MASTKKILVVFGATDTQGQSVVKSILSDSNTAAEYHIRAITSDLLLAPAQKMIADGVEVVKVRPYQKVYQAIDAKSAKKANPSSKDSLKNVLRNAHSVFAVTNFWEKGSAEVEIEQGKNMVDVARETGVKFFIWSSLIHVTELSGGQLKGVRHFDSKAEVEKYIRSTELPAAFFLPGFFMSNLPGKIIRPSPATGAFTIALPIPITSPIPLLDAERDTGKFIKSMLQNQAKVEGKRILGATAYYSPQQMMEEFKASRPQYSKDAVAVEIPPEVFTLYHGQMGFSPVIREEMLQNMQLMAGGGFGYYGGESLDFSHSILSDRLTTWSEYSSQSDAWSEPS